MVRLARGKEGGRTENTCCTTEKLAEKAKEGTPKNMLRQIEGRDIPTKGGANVIFPRHNTQRIGREEEKTAVNHTAECAPVWTASHQSGNKRAEAIKMRNKRAENQSHID